MGTTSMHRVLKRHAVSGFRASDNAFTGQNSSRPPLLFTERRLKCKCENLVLPLLPASKGSHDPCRVKTVARLT